MTDNQPANQNSEIELLVDNLRYYLSRDDYNFNDRDKAVRLVKALIDQAVLAGRIDEVTKFSHHLVRTGYAGDHDVYQTGFNVQKRLAELNKLTSEKS